MRVALELQALPVPAAQRKDVDHYSASLARAMIAHPGNHDIHIVVNHSSADAIEDLQNEFPDLVQSGNFRVWQLPYSGAPAGNSHWRRGAAELLREHWLLQVKPDVVLCGLSTGTCDAGVVSELRFAGVPTAITLHELFPSLNRETYASDPFVSASMQERSALCMEQLREADLVLTISGYCRGQILDALGLQPESVVAIPPAADVRFRCRAVSAEHERAVRMRFALNHDLVMSVGGTAYRKNIEGLIEAYALLPFELRKGHQLAVVGRIDDDEGRRLHGLARSKGLADGELTVTGYVSDEELTTLYNICKAFVFPSLREVFSLPPLEAMSCGAPVIGSNRTSIPEVIGLAEALFDPVSTPSMSEKIYKVLTDTEFRAKLKAHGMEQARRFSWQESARQALDALEELHCSRRKTRRTHPPSPKSRPRLAYISPLPPERSGIADYSAELLPELAKYYEIDLITDLGRIDDPYLQNGFRRRPFAEFEKSAHHYDRVLYHIGNSPFHRQIPSFLQRYPGSVVLHDFFLSHLFNYLERVDGSKALQRSLYVSHGYPGLLTWARKGAEAAIWTYPCNLSVLSQAQGIIVHSERAKQLARESFSISAENWAVIPQLRRIPKIISREDARRALGIPPKKFLVCSFGFLAPTKLNERLFDSWLASSLVNRKDCHLVFVGGDGEGKPYQVDGPWSSQIRVTGYLSKEDYQLYLFAADVGVQLRGVLSRGETPRSVFDCMAHGLATIVNAHPMLADLPADSVMTLSEGFGIGELVGALERFYRDPEYRTELGQGAQQYVRDKLDPALIARQYADAVEKFAADHPVALTNRLVAKIAGLPAAPPPSDDDLARVASCIAENSGRCGPRQLLVDITILSTYGDFHTGIQRVTRGILSRLLEKPPNGYRVEAVCRRFGQVYHYARDFMFKSLGLDALSLDDAPVTVYPGDIFLGLDWDSGIDEPAYKWLLHHRQRGMAVHFVVYDLLPWRHADWFPTEMKSNFLSWLSGLSRVATGFVCISRATADELLDWLEIHQPTTARALDVGYFHLGSDIEESWPSKGLDAPTRILLEKLEDQDVLMMIGTVEPRKGHSQVLSAMERLWAEGEDVSLLIFGKQGWMVESMAQRLRSHAELGRRLFWLDQASDEALLQLYSIASGVLMASEGEGFGLPLVEAARQGVPIIARDLRVFREIAGEHAFYFSGTDPAGLASALRTWLNLYRRGEHPKSDKLVWLTWGESTQELLRVLLEGKLYKHWRPARTLFLNESAPQTADGRPAEPERDSLADSELGTDYTPNGTGTALPAAILASRR